MVSKKIDAIHTFAREGELDNLLKCIESGVSMHLQELKTRIKKYFEGDEEALPSVLEAILRRKLAGKHEETDDELMDELEVQPRDDVDDKEFELDFDNLYSTDEEILAILAMFLMK
ncbi:hypothetical protein ES319_D07G244500v1 [Gossypium barbadense]|uniref:Uncharacterized protein n=2 Tax=Gossypium TaxID=3633 RepID=A0A5J5QW90_GOSBA|nr:hypothetical protein ES319_D07G244500v1 [Gossypium barbadense]TYH64344.1 hypothetical protein ES332_D07G260500v1 [Gossypium tomentosum]